VCEAILLAYSHTGDFLSSVIRHENGGAMPALIWRKFLGENESMRHRVVSRAKNGSRFVRIPAAVHNVEIKPASFSQNLCSGLVECIHSRKQTLGMALGCQLQWYGHEIHKRIDSVREVATDLLVNTEDNAMARGLDEPRSQDIADAARQYKIVVPLARS
jgi:hypothetical protein